MPLRANKDAIFILVKGYSMLTTEKTHTRGTRRKRRKIEHLKSFNKYQADLKTDAGTSPYIIEGIQALPGGTARSRVMITAVIRVFFKASIESVHPRMRLIPPFTPSRVVPG